jgi:aminoglycoside phosphotransferase (APT) family kinase protein
MVAAGQVKSAHQFDQDKLAAFLKDQRLMAAVDDLNIQQFQGGQSNPTFLLTAGSKRYVLRKKPPGKLLPSAHMVEREYKVMKALEPLGYPVPAMHVLCEDDGVIGTAFYVMDFVEGRIYENPALLDDGVTPADRTAIYQSMIDTMAQLHAVDPAAVGLADFGRQGGYIERQISRWSKQFEASRTEAMPAMDELIAWLPDNIPGPDETTVVHGDFRTGNLILDPKEPKVIAVLDWELATLGHPLSDLAYNCLGYHFPRENQQFNGMVGLDFAALGIPNEEQVVAMYCAATGRDGIADWNFYMAFNMFRISAICQGVYKRGLDGNASSENATDYGVKAQSAAKIGWQLAQKI